MKNLISYLHCAIASKRPKQLLTYLSDRDIKGKYKIFRFYEPNRLPPVCQQRQRWVVVEGHGCKLSVNINEHVGYRYLIQRKFDDTALYVAKRLGMGHESIFIDVGANIGTITVPLCSTLGCTAICIEASKWTASKLLENLSSNGITAKVVVAAATSPEDAGDTLQLSIPQNNIGAASLEKDYASLTSLKEAVPTFYLDQIVTKKEVKNVCLIKIDVEGFEVEVLRGSKRLLENTPPIIFEWLGERVGMSEAELRRILPEDYHLFSISEQGRISPFDAARNSRNVIAATERDIQRLENTEH